MPGIYGALGTNTAPFLELAGAAVPPEGAVDLWSHFPDPDVHVAHVDGNGRHDLVILKLDGGDNHVGVGLATGDEQPFYSFNPVLQEHPDASQGDWSSSRVFTGNVDGGDGNNREDLLFISSGEPSIIYTGRARASD